MQSVSPRENCARIGPPVNPCHAQRNRFSLAVATLLTALLTACGGGSKHAATPTDAEPTQAATAALQTAVPQPSPAGSESAYGAAKVPAAVDPACDGETYTSGGAYALQFGRPDHGRLGPLDFKAIKTESPAVRICVREFSVSDSAIPIEVRQLMGPKATAIVRIQAIGAFDQVADKMVQLYLRFNSFGETETERQVAGLKVGWIHQSDDGHWTRAFIPSTQVRQSSPAPGGGQWWTTHIMMRADVTEPGYYYIDRP